MAVAAIACGSGTYEAWSRARCTNLTKKQKASPVVVEDDVWLGAHVVITSGVTVGQGSVVGANSIVINDIASNFAAGGVLAKTLKTRGPLERS